MTLHSKTQNLNEKVTLAKRCHSATKRLGWRPTLVSGANPLEILVRQHPKKMKFFNVFLVYRLYIFNLNIFTQILNQNKSNKRKYFNPFRSEIKSLQGIMCHVYIFFLFLSVFLHSVSVLGFPLHLISLSLSLLHIFINTTINTRVLLISNSSSSI